MIDLQPPWWEVPVSTGPERATVLVFRDHADPGLRHVLPALARLVRDQRGGPLLRLLRWRYPPSADPDQSKAGGFATFSTEVPLPEAWLDRVEAELRAQGDEPRSLVAALAQEVEAHLVLGHRDGDRSIEDQRHNAHAAVLPPHPAAFALSLDARGAALLRAAAAGGDLPAGVVYSLRYEGLLPSARARATVDYEAVYRHFSAALSGQYSVARAELGASLEQLRQEGVIVLQIDRLSEEDDGATESLAMAILQAKVESELFRSALPPTAEAPNPLASMLGGLFGGGRSGGTGAGSAVFVLKARFELKEELRRLELDLSERRAIPLENVVTRWLSGAFAPEDVDLRDIDIEDETAGTLRVHLEGDLRPEHLPDLLSGTLTLAAGPERRSWAFHPGSTLQDTFLVALAPSAERRWSWEGELQFDPNEGIGPAGVQVQPTDSDSSIFVLHPQDWLWYRSLRIVAGPRVEGGLAGWEVELRLLDGETPVGERLLRLLPGEERSLPLRLPLGAKPKIEASIYGIQASGDRVDLRRGAIAGELLLLPSPPPFEDDLLLLAVLGAALSVVVELRGGDRGEVTVIRFDPGGPTEAHWRRPTTGAPSWRQTVLRGDGTLSQSDWCPIEGRVLVVGRVDDGRLPLSVLVLRGRGVSAVEVGVTPDQPDAGEQTFLLSEAELGQTRVLLISNVEGALRYRWRISAYDPLGGVLSRTGVGRSANLILPLPMPTP